MKKNNKWTIAAAMVATIVISVCSLSSCKGRRMSYMEPDGDTVEVVIGNPDTSSSTDTIPGQS